MVTRIQQQRGAAAGVLDYNENKVEKGVAWPIECVGMNNDPYSIYRTFEPSPKASSTRPMPTVRPSCAT